MKTFILISILFLLSCRGKGKNGAPLDQYDSGKDSSVKPDSALVSDADNKDTSAAYLLRIRGNRKPVALAGADQLDIKTADLTLDGSKSYDPDGSITKALWVQENGPLVTIVNSTSLVAKVTNIAPGKRRFRLTVTDNRLSTATDTILTIKKDSTIVTPPPPPPPINKPPTVNAGPDITVTIGQSVTLTAVGKDPELGALTYKWNTGETTASITVVYTLAGVYNPSVTVIDPAGASATDALIVTVNPTSMGTRNNLIFESTFEGVSNWAATTLPTDKGVSWGNEQHCCSYSVVQAPIARSGSKAVKFELRKGDPLVSTSSRSEISGLNESSMAERWYGVSFYVTANDDGKDQSLIQWRPNSSSGSAMISLQISGNTWSLVSPKPGATLNTAAFQYNDIGAVTPGKWTDFVFHIKWSTGSDGLIEVWKDGVKVKTVNGTSGYSGGNYVKVGVYKWTWEGLSADGTSRIVYADDVRIGNNLATYNDVAP